MERERLIYHVDVNSAFLSWEAVYRLSLDENVLDLRTVPAVVGGDPASRHGIVLAKSMAAKAFNIVTGEPLVQARRKCPNLLIVPSRFDVYLKYSGRLIELLADYTPDIEKFSIDEAFMDMTETVHLFGDPLAVADELRKRIRTDLGFTVNVGISSNKLLAKMASDFEKPDRTHTLYPAEVPAKLWPLPLRNLFFVGNAAQKKMQGIGLRTVGDIASCDLTVLKAHLGDKYAAQIKRYANGIDSEAVGRKESSNKGYGNSITLSHDICDYETADQVLLALSETVGARLRAGNVSCSTICVELKDWNFKSHSHQSNLPVPTDSTTVIFETARKLLRESWDLTPVRLLGIRTGKIGADTFRQLTLFDGSKVARMKDFEKAIDQIREKYGIDSVKRASFLNREALIDHAVSRKKHLKKEDSEASRRQT